MSAMDTSMPAETGGKLSEIQRMSKMFFEPSVTFADLKRNASWWGPFLLISVMSVVFVFFVGQKVGWEAVVDGAMAKMSDSQKSRLEQMPPEAQARQRAGMVTGYKYGSWASPIFILLFFLFLALIYWGIFNFGMGKTVSFKQTLAVIMYSSVPTLIRSVLAIILLFVGIDAAGFDLENPVPATNLGMLVERASNPGLSVFLTRLDIFTIWATILTGIGLSVLTGVKRSTSIIISFVVLLVMIGVPALIAAM
jgi:hypothetical protein